MTSLLLSYRRVGEHFEGTLGIERFAHQTFSEMMLLASSRVVREGITTLNLRRTDRPGLAVVTMEPQLLELLASTPAEYIRLHSPPDRHVVVRGTPAPRPSQGATPLLRAGHDTLAAAFGDKVYLRVRSGRVESPDTGRWDRLPAVEVRMGLPAPLEVVYTDTESMSGWALIDIELLLKHSQPLFYLPRVWNPHAGWIQRSQLQELYDAYQKEKSACLSEVT